MEKCGKEFVKFSLGFPAIELKGVYFNSAF